MCHEDPQEHEEEGRLKGRCVAACCSPQEGRLMVLLCHECVGNVRAPRAPPACGESPPGTKLKKATAVLLETLNCLAGSCSTEHFSCLLSYQGTFGGERGNQQTTPWQGLCSGKAPNKVGESLSLPWIPEKGSWPSLVLLNQPNTTS